MACAVRWPSIKKPPQRQWLFYLEKLIQIYPNPTAKNIFIENKSHGIINKIAVLDNFGRVVLNFENNPSMIDITNLNRGIYFIQINIEGVILNKKIIII